MKTYKYRIYPTKTQASEIDLQTEKNRQLYNTLLGLKKDAYKKQGNNLSRKDLYKQTKDNQNIHSQVSQNVADRINKAYGNFFARVKRGEYVCAACGKGMGTTTWRTYKSGKKKGQPKKVKDAVVDHIEPVVDPLIGFTTWDSYIERMFCEVDNLQVICHDCHEMKCAEERELRKRGK